MTHFYGIGVGAYCIRPTNAHDNEQMIHSLDTYLLNTYLLNPFPVKNLIPCLLLNPIPVKNWIPH